MGKKDAKEMAQPAHIFVAGAEKNKLPRAKAILLFRSHGEVAGYGFNKSHAAAYALIAYQIRILEGAPCGRVHGGNLSAVMTTPTRCTSFTRTRWGTAEDARARRELGRIPLRAVDAKTYGTAWAR